MSRWAELVFHVLAHVPSKLAPSVYDPAWIGFVERHAGSASKRPLAEDAAILAAALIDHDTSVRVQMLAWLWRDEARASRCSDRVLRDLTLDDVDDPRLLPLLTSCGAAVEILRAAAELEAEVLAALPPARGASIDEALEGVARAAPFLSCCSVSIVRPLRLRGRVRGRHIWVGAPGDVGAAHVGWQAAHEATVAEISERARAAGVGHRHDALEHCALVLLHERARGAGLVEEHRAWLAHFAELPELAREAIDPKWRGLLDQSLEARA